MADYRLFGNPLQIRFAETPSTPRAIQSIAIWTPRLFDRLPIHDPVTTRRTPKHIAPRRVFNQGIRTHRPVKPADGRLNHFFYPNESLPKLVWVASCRIVPGNMNCRWGEVR